MRHTSKTWFGRITCGVLLILSSAILPRATAETVLRVAMTAGDVPITIAQPDQGFEG